MEILKSKNVTLGFITIFIWCVLTAIGYVYTNSLEQQTPLALMCFILFSFPSIIFSLLNYKNLPELLQRSKHHLKNIFTINIATLGGWTLLMYAIKYIEPSVANTMILACIPISTLWINKFNKHHMPRNKQNYITAILLGGGVVYLIYLILTGNTVQLGSSFHNIVISIVLCILSAFFLAINNIYIKQLSNAEFSPLDILTVRFMFCALATGIYTLFAGEMNTHISLAALSPLLLNACILIVIPQIAMQISMRELEPFTISVIMPFMPVLMFFMESFNKRLHSTLEVFAGIVGIFIISLIGSAYRYRAEKILRVGEALIKA